MTSDPSKDSAHRQRTDDSLKSERDKTDRAIADRQAAVEGAADRVTDRARGTADAVLSAARERADEQLKDSASTDAGTRAILADARASEDDVLRGEREAADETLKRERRENARALMALLPLEREVTDRYLTTERMQSDNALSYRDDLLGAVTHDVRELLGGIVMTAGLLSKRADASNDAVTQGAAARIQRYAARMNRLVSDLVDVASIDAGKLGISRVRGDLAALVAEAVDTFQIAAAANEVTLTAEFEERPLLAEFDYERLLQVLANLITNAIKFTPAGGAICVRCEHIDDGSLRVSVQDTGPGIPGDALETIFERYRQVTENDRRGLGLGLYISKRLVEAHGGSIWAESEPGKGMTVRFTLPLPDERRQT